MTLDEKTDFDAATSSSAFESKRLSRWGWLSLIALTIVGAILAFWGLGYGLPHDSRPDEIPNLQVVFSLLADLVGGGQNGLNPHVFNYGTLYYYGLTLLYWLFYSVGQLMHWWVNFSGMQTAYMMAPAAFHLIIRVVSALSATAMIPLMFFTARAWRNERVAWIAAIFTASCYLLIRNAHFGSPDVVMTLGILASLYTLLRYQSDVEPNSKNRYLKWSAIWIALSASIKIPAILMAVPFFWACISTHISGERIAWRPAFLLAFKQGWWGLLVFGLTSPWLFLDFPGVMQSFAYEAAFYEYSLPGMPSGWQFYPTFALPIGLGFLVYAFSLMGIAFLCFQKNSAKRAQNITLLLSVIVFALFLGPNLRIMTRYALPLVPMLLLLSADTVSYVLQRVQQALSLKRAKAILALWIIGVGVCLLEPLKNTLLWDYLLSQGDTRQIAANWLLSNVPPNSPVAIGPRLGHMNLPTQYGQLMLETGPNNLRPPKKADMQVIDIRSRLINTYQPEVLKQLGIRYVVMYGGNLLFSTPQREAKPYLEQYPLVFKVSSQKPNMANLISRPSAAVYDPMDALFIPYAGLEDMAYTGPDVYIFDLQGRK